MKPPLLILLVSAAVLLSATCKSSRNQSGFAVIGPADETADAAKLVVEANQELAKIKLLYKNNENKREELKKALESNDSTSVRKIADDIVYLIGDGATLAKGAVEKIEQAEDLNANADYKEYLKLKGDALNKQLEAFENYRQAARSLRDNYDPKNVQLRDKVKEEFSTRSESYQKIMEKARELSNQANDLAKAALQKQKAG